MTRIDQHSSHPLLERSAVKPIADQDEGQDFLKHLRDGTLSHADGRPARNDTPPADENRLPHTGVAPGTSSTRPQAIGQFEGAPFKITDVAGASNPMRTDDLFQTRQLASVPLAQAVEQTRVFEQHWFANGYLSFIADAGASEPGVTKQSDGRAAMPIGSAAIVHSPDTAIPPTERAPSGVSPVEMSWPVMVEGPANMSDAPSRSIERMASALGPLVAADQPWPERLLRLSQKADGKAALWVRDYGLSAEAIDPLVANLRQLARHAGIALDRVVVNGTVIWHSESLEGNS
jgi:hypothetical protein